MKKTPTIIVLTILSLTPALARTQFSDLNTDSKVYDAVMYSVDNGIVKGYADGTFRENSLINRAEFTKILLEAKYKNELETCLNIITTDTVYFTDVPKDAWFAKHICLAKQKGIVQGYADGTFKPAQTITFGEASKIISLTFGGDEKFAVAEPWYKSFATYLTIKRVVPTAIERFDHPLTRGEMTEMIFRLLANVRYKEYMTYADLEHQGNPMHTTCQAYFQGFVPDYAKNMCVLAGTSDCSNPFTYDTEDVCEKVFKLK